MLMNTSDRFIKQKLKGWAAHQEPPAESRARLLKLAATAAKEHRSPIIEKNKLILDYSPQQEQLLNIQRDSMISFFYLRFCNLSMSA